MIQPTRIHSVRAHVYPANIPSQVPASEMLSLLPWPVYLQCNAKRELESCHSRGGQCARVVPTAESGKPDLSCV